MRVLKSFSIGILSAVTLSSCAPQSIQRKYVEIVPSQPEMEGEALPSQPETKEEIVPPLPKKAYLTVPFSPQAPFADWGDPYQEACEEASLIMMDHYLKEKTLSREQADEEILKMVAWQKGHGYPQDVNLTELATIARDYYGYETTLQENVTVDEIKKYIAAGNPVIVPAAGRDLGNPYFSGEGPWYHMLVITGYNKKYFITNDPGTKRGERYKYRHQVLLDAVHDWTGVKEEIRDGRRVMLVVKQN